MIRGRQSLLRRIYWDQASLLVQIGLIDGQLLPATGKVQAEKVLDSSVAANLLLGRFGNG